MTKVYRKGLPFSAEVAPLIGAMPLLDEYREPLMRLQGAWDSLALLGQMSGAATDMADTRSAFEALTGRLLDSLARRQLRNAVQQLQGRSQVAIDILIRNLFERTADVGFLASDGPLRAALQDDEDPQALRQRFAAYVAKYSVYDQVVLLAADGRRIAALDESRCAPRVDEPALRAAFEPGRAFVEAHGATALLGGQPGLVYAAAVNAGSGEASGPRGLLCLSFKLEDEMLGLFRALCAGVKRSVLVLKDGEGRVLLTSDPWQIPLGAPLADAGQAQGWRLDFAGRDYLSCSSAASGYEGYFGPGWTAQMLQPLQHAFSDAPPERQEGRAGQVDTRELFDEELRSIPIEARRIQRELSRSLWNGKLKSRAQTPAVASAGATGGVQNGSAFAVTLLNEVERTGDQLRQVFERAIAQLEDGALGAVFDAAGFQAELAISIVNRNLYERANDCRWWALDARLQRALATGDAASASAVLASIHALYTVYSLLLVFDTAGRVVAVSDPAQAHHVGRSLQGEWVAGALGLRDASRHVVSAHEPCGLYGEDGHAPCLVYAAGVPHPEGGGQVGGIAIVFDGAPQFRAMLRAALPAQPGAAALLVTRAGEVVASSDERWQPGDRAPVSLAVLQGLAADRQVTGELDHQGRVQAFGLAMSGGYREYRRLTPPDATDLAALVLLPLGERLEDGAGAASQAAFEPQAPVGTQRVDIASFLVDHQWLGLPALQVLAALERQRITAWPQAPAAVRGMLGFEGRMLPVLDLGQLLFNRPCGDEAALMVCQTAAGQRLVLAVQQLGQVFVAGAEQMQPSPTRPGWAAQAQVRLLKGQGPSMLTLLDGDDLWRLVSGVAEAAASAAPTGATASSLAATQVLTLG
ncbi:MAG: chemotaxis protein CheW [Mitsuaria chitosanitabida]|uniref:chemotaxis protein CheW n=1 Tax=Roseateles chitosanitabidus TaxID=65048 RepID=UPI001B215CB5|nr:chemotaxis protein CheW [Roseateles chitosanitabidus]MBO9689451.1 chemotaxis protein CheW [Roseateles chitosanitabidus]